jgi:DNA repair protein RadC
MKKRLDQIPEFDRPREKMVRKGPRALSSLELLCVLLGSGIKGKDVFAVASDILKATERGIDTISMEKLMHVDGVGLAKACQIMAAIEYSRRLLVGDDIRIKSVDDVLASVNELKDKKQEYFLTLTLDGASRLIQKRTVFIGSLNKSMVHPREVFADAIGDRAAGIIFVHNHPSGDADPSDEDFAITERLLEVAKVMGIDVMDHIIVGKKGHFSFRSEGLLK